MSTSRSISVRPCDGATVADHSNSPVASVTATTLPLSKPAMTMSPLMTGEPLPRSVRRGTGCSYTQASVPSVARNARSLPSTVRTTTSPPAMTGAASTSPPTGTRQRSAPDSASSATSSPLDAPATTMPSPAAGPPESGSFVVVRQRSRPVASSIPPMSPP
jgi:hypothetical protein